MAKKKLIITNSKKKVKNKSDYDKSKKKLAKNIKKSHNDLPPNPIATRKRKLSKGKCDDLAESERFKKKLEKVSNQTDQCLTNNHEILDVIQAVLNIEQLSFVVCDWNLNITRQNIQSLEDGKWVDDTIIDAYFSMVQDKIPNIYFFSIQFMTNFDECFELRLGWARNINLFELDKVFWPVNVNSNHWVLFVFDVHALTITIYDSLRDGIAYINIFESIKRYLIAKKNEELQLRFIIANDIPYQTNSYDCGIFTIKYGHYLARNKDLNFSQASMRNFRRKIIFEIVTNRFLDDGIDLLNNEINNFFDLNAFKCKSDISNVEDLISETNLKFENMDVNFESKDDNNVIKKSKKGQKNYLCIALDHQNINDVQRFDVGNLDIECPYCHALYFKNEIMNCCHKGDLVEELMPIFKKNDEIVEKSVIFKDLFNGNHPSSNQFFDNIRALNAIFSFSSIGFNSKLKKNQALITDATLGSYSIKIHGEIFHQIGSILPMDGKERKHSQLLYFDSHFEELERRNSILKENMRCELPLELLDSMQTELHKLNELYKTFRPIGRDIINNENLIMVIRDDYKKLKIDKVNPKLYERPSTDDFGGIIPSDNFSFKYSKDIIVQRQDNRLIRINEQHPILDSFGYILLFIGGILGWSPSMQFKQGSGCKLNSEKKSENFCSMQENFEFDMFPDDDFPLIDEENILNFDNLFSENQFQNENKSTKSMRSITLLLFLNFMLQFRKGAFNILFKARRLFHQYLVNKWVDYETLRLDFYRKNQKKLRIDLYKNLLEAIHRFEKSRDLGSVFVLPSTHPGSPRQMFELYQDAMAIVGHFGKPDLFLTMTCNPKWPEIQRQLLKGQLARDRPDLICRIFNLKLNELLDDVVEKKIFGEIEALVYVVEFQKRGLPHAHLLIILKSQFKLDSTKKIDSVVSAEIPDAVKHPKLSDLVCKHMIHLPCHYTKLRKCKNGFIKGQCNKKFPKKFEDFTIMEDDTYPSYKRRNTGKIIKEVGKHIIEIDNSYVVPYNPYLLMKFDCHINVEICSTVLAVKYLYKYVYKGFDRALVEIVEGDEIKNYVNSRYVSSVEAYWRLKGFKMHGRLPAVVRFPVHLENQQNVLFKPNDDLAQILKNKCKTQLTEWFFSNQNCNKNLGVDINFLTYFDYPKYFRWNQNKWIRRQRNIGINKSIKKVKDKNKNGSYQSIVVRTHHIPIKDSERYFLKAILQKQKGAKSYEDLLTVNLNGINHKCKSFREAASLNGLLLDDKIWFDTMNEAIKINCNSKKLRKLFTNMLVHCELANPLKFWENFKNNLGDDFKFLNKSINESELEKKILNEIAANLSYYDKSLGDYQINFNINKVEQNYHILNEDNSNLNYNSSFLSEEQLSIYNMVENVLIERSKDKLNLNLKNLINIDGGYGKTYLLNHIATKMIQKGFIVVSVAHSGVASILLNNGRTAHSMFKVPRNLPEEEETYCSIKKNSKLADFIKQIDLIIYDEITMSPSTMLRCLDRTFKELCGDEYLNLSFANKIILTAGDWRQTLPVIKPGNRYDVVRNCLINSEYWPLMNCFKLTYNFRLGSNNINYANYLLKIGEGKIMKNENDLIELDGDLIQSDNNIDNFFEFIFPEETFNENHIDQYKNCMIVTAYNRDVHRLNSILLKKFKSNNLEITYLSQDYILPECEMMNIPTKILNLINQSGMPIHHLNLKTGCLVTLLKTIDPLLGMCNGTRLIVISLNSNLIRCKIISDDKFNDSIVEIFRTINISDEFEPIQFKRIQFPLHVGYVSSIHRVQGRTLSKMGLYHKNPLFSHGQLYVALSRTRSKKLTKVFLDNNDHNNLIPNIVYNEIIQDL